MRLIAASIRNYRIHQKLDIEFDSGITLIGGPNESGKSTFVEALHRALFLKAKGNTVHHREMQSRGDASPPEVELTFDVQGKPWRLSKRFGATGSVRLTPPDAGELTDENAESRLATIIDNPTGLNTANVADQWAHLWVWQGRSGEDPAARSKDKHGTLLNRLQSMGGAGVMQSDRDEKVALHFMELCGTWFNQNGRPKAGSPLFKAMSALERSQVEADKAREDWNQIEQTSDNLTRAREDVAKFDAQLIQLRAEKKATLEQLDVVRKLNQKLADAAQVLKEADVVASGWHKTEEQVRSLGMQADAQAKALAPLRDQITKLEAQFSIRRDDCAGAEREFHVALERSRTARMQLELAAVYTSLEKVRSDLEKLAKEDVAVSKLQQSIGLLRTELAGVPDIQKRTLTRIAKLQSAVHATQAALEAMAVSIEVVEADQQVRIGERPLNLFERYTLTEMDDVHIGSNVRLRIVPGGGDNLAKAREAHLKARDDLRLELDQWRLTAPEEAEAVALKRTSIETRLREEEVRMEGHSIDEMKAQREVLEKDQARLKAEAVRLGKLLPGSPIDPGGDAACAWEIECQVALKTAETTESGAKVKYEFLRKARDAGEDLLASTRKKSTSAEAELTATRIQLDFIVQQHGTDDVIVAKRVAADAAALEARKNWETKKSELKALQPDLLEERQNRLECAIADLEKNLGESRQAVVEMTTRLTIAGSGDPRAALDLAEARLRSAQQNHISCERQAGAVRLLHELFTTEKATLAAQLTQPLKNRVSGYLECLFPLGSNLHLDFEGQTFRNVRLARPGERGTDTVFEFDRLSLGAREQTAVAVRLAMAELLADAHDGSLPIVLDDAFAHSDPVRVRQLHDMLFRAANRGLQIILLTCNPSDYTALGGKTIQLERNSVA